MTYADAPVLPQNRSDMGDGNAYAGRMWDRMPWFAENGGRRAKNRLRSLEEPYEAYVGSHRNWKQAYDAYAG